jgi:hypothetical protein
MASNTPTAGTARLADADEADRNSRGSRGSGVDVTDPKTSVIRRRSADELDDEQPEDDRHANAFVSTLKFLYRHSTALVPASVLWVLCSLPLVTVGPASLGVYSLVLSLRETGRVDRGRVVETVRENLVPATLLGFLPVTFVAIAMLYVLSGLATGLVGTALTAVALYGGLYVGVLLIPTFVSMAGGVDPKTALRESYVWLAGSPVTGLQLLLVTAVILVATVSLSIGFLLLFAGATATYHVEVLSRVVTEEESLPSFAAR